MSAGRIAAGLVLALGSVYWVLLAWAVIRAIGAPAPQFAHQFLYTGLWLTVLGGVLGWGWRRFLARPRHPLVDEDGHLTTPDPPERPGPHLGLSGENEPPRRW